MTEQYLKMTASLQRLFYPSPRAGRAEYFAGLLQGFVLIMGLGLFSGALSFMMTPNYIEQIAPFTTAAFILLFLSVLVRSVCLSIRRLHDLGFSGFFAFLLIIPWLNLVFWIFLLFRKGHTCDNKFGGYPEWREPGFYELNSKGSR